MSKQVQSRGEIVAKFLHECDPEQVAALLAKFHSHLESILGSRCAMHGVLNTYQGDFGMLGDADTGFFCSLLSNYEARGDKPVFNALINYQTRTRVCQASYTFDQTLGSGIMCFTMPDPAHGFRLKQVRGLLGCILEYFEPEDMSYQSGFRMSF